MARPGSSWLRGNGWPRLVAVLMAAGALAACASTVNPAPFKAYADASRQIQGSAATALGAAYDWSRQGFLNEATPGSAIVALLLVQEPGDPFGWQPPEGTVILPLKVAAFQRGVDPLNQALVSYADLLAQLASSELTSTDQFDQLAKDLNANLQTAAAALKVASASPGGSLPSRATGIFSAAASEVARAFVAHKRKADLRRALGANQEGISELAELGQSAARGTATVIRKEYERQSTDIARQAFKSGPRSARSDPASVRALLELDEKYIGQLAILHSLYNAYGRLPAAHRELAASLDAKKPALEQIQAFYQEARRVQHLYEELKSQSQAAP